MSCHPRRSSQVQARRGGAAKKRHGKVVRKKAVVRHAHCPPVHSHKSSSGVPQKAQKAQKSQKAQKAQKP